MMNIRYMKFIYISFILVFLSTKVFTQNVINIFVDLPDTVNKDKYEKAYKDMEEAYSKDQEDSSTKIQFKFSETQIDRSTSNGYIDYLKDIIKHIEDPSIDMFILYDDFLFSETGMIESGNIYETLGKRQIHNNYLDFKEYSNYNETWLSNYSQDILESCKYEEHVYALPFEIDYDVLFYRSNGNSTLDNIDSNNMSWEYLEEGTVFNGETVVGGNKYMSIGLMEENELLNFFVEYISSFFNFEEKKTYEKLCNEDTIINNFSKFVTSSQGLNIALKSAFDTFVDNKSLILKGKISYYSTLNETDETIKYILLPESKSILYKKYLVINKNSSKDKDLLYRTAYYLHNEEMQQKRFDLYKMVPPSIEFMNNDDTQYNEYKNFYGKMERINIKKVFSDEKSAPFMEIEHLLPEVLKDLTNHKNDYQYVQNVFENIKKVLMDKKDVKQLPIYIVFIPAVVFLIGSIVVIFLIIKNKEHPNLKIYSPYFCILIILGLSFSIVTSCLNILNVQIGFCKYVCVIATINTDLTLFPMVAVTYRIYKILTNTTKVSVGKNLNRNVVILFIVLLGGMILYSYICAFHVYEFFLTSSGSIKTYREPQCEYDGKYFILESIERRINEIIYVIMVYMVVRTAKVSKKFGEFKYVYMMLVIGIYEYLGKYLSQYISQSTYYYFHIAIISGNVFIDGLLIYFLIGSRLIYVITHPEENKKKKAKVFKNGFFDTLTGQKTTTYDEGGNHSHFIDISKTENDTRCDSFNNKKYHCNCNLSSNTTFSEYDYRYDSKNDIFNKNNNKNEQNPLSSNSTPCNDYYLGNSSSAYLLNHSSQKTVGQDYQFSDDDDINNMNLNINGNMSNGQNISIQNFATPNQPKFSLRNISFFNRSNNLNNQYLNNNNNNNNNNNFTNLSMKNNINEDPAN